MQEMNVVAKISCYF